MPVSVVVPEKLPGQKVVTMQKEKKKNLNFLAYYKNNRDLTFLMYMYSLCGGQHTNTNI